MDETREPGDVTDVPDGTVLPTALEAAMRRAAETGRPVLIPAEIVNPVDPRLARIPPEMRPVTPLDAIPDAAARSRETVEETWNRMQAHLDPKLKRRLAALPPRARRALGERIVRAERRKETIATATETPSPKQRREARRHDEP